MRRCGVSILAMGLFLMTSGALSGCSDDATFIDDDGASPSADQDNDGYAASEDCDDSDPQVYPGAPEQCDDKDNDCDGVTDAIAGSAEPSSEGLESWYADADEDGYGDPDVVVTACVAPAGYVASSTDCDDSAASVYPGAPDVCDGIDDHDCDGSADPLEADVDGDGQSVCQGDCDDQDAGNASGSAEQCDGADNDCDGIADNGISSAWYPDLDEDGFGGPTGQVSACEAPTGYIADGTDCDDAQAAVHPGATETCDGLLDNDCDGTLDPLELDGDEDGQSACQGDCDDTDPANFAGNEEQCDGADNDCDGVADDGLTTIEAHVDADDDGFGDPATGLPASCGALPDGYVANAADCDDAQSSVHPGAPDLCDGIVDNNCDGTPDPQESDADNDGQSACQGDCNDADPAAYGGNPEVCDGTDNDCDGLIDDGLVVQALYPDADNDGYGDVTAPTATCGDIPDGYSTDHSDCDDGNADVHPGAADLCDGIDDNDCDGQIDSSEDDGDGDGQTACAGDCDDGDPTNYAGNAEVCDGADNDCDEAADEALPQSTLYADHDGDGFGDAATSAATCAATLEGYVNDDTDCDDLSSATYPDADEVCDGIADNSCDGTEDPLELDGDGDGQSSCAGDCEDDDAGNYSGNTEMCDSADNDCDGTVDDGLVVAWYQDADNDGYGNPSIYYSTCKGQPAGYVSDGTDCDDTDPQKNPGLEEAVGDGIDNNCDGVSDADIFVTYDGSSPEPGKPVFASIQAAIDAAVDGQVVAVGPGTYQETLEFRGKAIIVVAWEGPEETTVDADGTGSVLSFIEAEGPDSVFTGFTLTGGTGSDARTCGVSIDYTYGGGVCLDGASPTLEDLVITGSRSDYGAGLFMLSASPSLTHITLTGNVAVNTGGGMFIQSSTPDMSDLSVESNSARYGAGIAFLGSDGVLTDTALTGNAATDYGGALHLDTSDPSIEQVSIRDNQAGYYGGGGYLYYSDPYLTNVRIEGNSGGSGGGGIHMAYSAPQLTHVAVLANTTTLNGGGLKMDNAAPELTDVIIAGNAAGFTGGGVYSSSSSSIFTNVVMSANVAASAGGAMYLYYAHPTITGGIIAFNQAGSGSNIYNYSGDLQPDINYSCFYRTGGTAGLYQVTLSNTDLIADPQFYDNFSDSDAADDDYHLQATSPAIGLGDPDAAQNDPDGSRNDMGAYGGPAAAGWDLDGDGYYDWWNPATGLEAGIDDCDDDNPDVYPGAGC